MVDPLDVECNAGVMRLDLSLLVVCASAVVVGSCLIEGVVELVDILVMPDRFEAVSGAKQSIISFTMSVYVFKWLGCMLVAEYDAGAMRVDVLLLVVFVGVMVAVGAVAVMFMGCLVSCVGCVECVRMSCDFEVRGGTGSGCGCELGEAVDSCLIVVVEVEVDKVVEVELVDVREVEEGWLWLRWDGLLDDDELLDEDELLDDDELLEELLDEERLDDELLDDELLDDELLDDELLDEERSMAGLGRDTARAADLLWSLPISSTIS
jgi:hypothetical protein